MFGKESKKSNWNFQRDRGDQTKKFFILGSSYYEEYRYIFGAKQTCFLSSCFGSITNYFYSKAPKSVTTFNLFTFFRADLIQSEVNNCKLSRAFDWIKSARKNVNKLKVVTLLGALL